MKSLERAIMQIESGGDLNAIGDRHLEYMAYGPMQIRQNYCDDVNDRYGTHFEAKNLVGWLSVSMAVFWLYMSIYATRQQLGRDVTDEDRARIHNGGPSAWRPGNRQYEATTGYWEKVKWAMEQP